MNNTRNWKMRCIGISKYTPSIYTKDKIYEVKNLCFKWDNGDRINLKDMRHSDINNFEDFQNWSNSVWELVDEKYAEIEKYLYK